MVWFMVWSIVLLMGGFIVRFMVWFMVWFIVGRASGSGLSGFGLYIIIRTRAREQARCYHTCIFPTHS